jgi:hypothetical protein
MTTLTIPKQVNRIELAEYCSNNISKRSYWLHDQIGGEGWRIYSKSEPEDPNINWKIQISRWRIELDNTDQAIMIALKYGI